MLKIWLEEDKIEVFKTEPIITKEELLSKSK